jgi:hypothetical protein
MKLMTKELEAKFKKAGVDKTGDSNDREVIAKFFNPCGGGTWLATEYDPEHKLFYGAVLLFADIGWEWGEFSLEELESIKLPMGLSIERDLYSTGLTVRQHKGNF